MNEVKEIYKLRVNYKLLLILFWLFFLEIRFGDILRLFVRFI